MLSVIAEADRLMAVSRHTANVVAQAFAALGREVPPLRVAHPAGLSLAASAHGGPPPGFDAARPFVVYCSTITALCLDDERLALLRTKARACRLAGPAERPRALAESAGIAE